MRKAGTAHTKSSTDMENNVFMKAKTRVSVSFKCACYILTEKICSYVIVKKKISILSFFSTGGLFGFSCKTDNSF